MDKVTIVSTDSHAQMPPELWSEYLESQYHDLLPRLHRENDVYPGAVWLLTKWVLTLPELEQEHRTGGWVGARDAAARIAEMDREGIAAETVYTGDFRSTDLFFNVMNDTYSFDAWDAGVRAYDRWAADTFGAETDRIKLVSAIGSCTDMDATLAELDWAADHEFVATFCPGFMTHPGMPPLFDEYWDPFWARCVDRGLVVAVHAGFGWGQGAVYPELERLYRIAEEEDMSEIDLTARLATDIFNGDFFADVKPRRPMWQLMLGGVFDRHPELRLLLTEVRLDWVPALLQHLDARYADNRDALPAKRTPTEYWQSNCMAGASFIHKAEVEMRAEIGVDKIAFGRDYPHPEGTWPHTSDWLHDAFAGVPEDELRMMLGGNAIDFFGFDRAKLDAIASHIGPTVADITGRAATPAELIENFDTRSGYLKPSEGGSRLPETEELIRQDLARAGAPV